MKFYRDLQQDGLGFRAWGFGLRMATAGGLGVSGLGFRGLRVWV